MHNIYELRVRDESAIETNFEIEIETEFAIVTEIDIDLPIARSRSIYRLRDRDRDRFTDCEINLPIPRWISRLSTLTFHRYERTLPQEERTDARDRARYIADRFMA